MSNNFGLIHQFSWYNVPTIYVLSDKFYSLGFEEEVIYGIDIDVSTRRCSCQKRCPLPTIIFGIQQKICTNNRYTNCNDH